MSKHELLFLSQSLPERFSSFASFCLSAFLDFSLHLLPQNHTSKLHSALKSTRGTTRRCPKAMQTPTGLRYVDMNRKLNIASGVCSTAGILPRVLQMWNVNSLPSARAGAPPVESASSMHLWGTAFVRLYHHILEAHTTHCNSWLEAAVSQREEQLTHWWHAQCSAQNKNNHLSPLSYPTCLLVS